MEEFLVQNAKRYQALVKAFKPGASTQTSTEAKSSTNPDIVVSTRIRPLLEEEKSAGLSESVFPREAQPGVVDVHELRRPVRGLPTLKVCAVIPRKPQSKEARTALPDNVHITVLQLPGGPSVRHRRKDRGRLRRGVPPGSLCTVWGHRHPVCVWANRIWQDVHCRRLGEDGGPGVDGRRRP